MTSPRDTPLPRHQRDADMRALHANGHKVEAIAAAYNLSPKAVKTIVNGQPATADEVQAAAQARRMLELSHDPLRRLQDELFDGDDLWFCSTDACRD
jgi:hypothetical protein